MVPVCGQLELDAMQSHAMQPAGNEVQPLGDQTPLLSVSWQYWLAALHVPMPQVNGAAASTPGSLEEHADSEPATSIATRRALRFWRKTPDHRKNMTVTLSRGGELNKRGEEIQTSFRRTGGWRYG